MIEDPEYPEYANTPCRFFGSSRGNVAFWRFRVSQIHGLDPNMFFSGIDAKNMLITRHWMSQVVIVPTYLPLP